tara:strand:+ start:245 stop:646 length:402 start_codon:yes stop_codon:yes gene_type:complete
MATPFKMKGSPMQRNFGISPVKQINPVAAIKAGIKGVKLAVKTGKKIYNKIKGTKTTPKPNKSTYVSDLKKGTVTETTSTGSKITRDSWPKVKPGKVSDFPHTSTTPGGIVGPFDPMKRQVIHPKYQTQNRIN